MAHRVRWLTISIAFVLAALPMAVPSEASAAGPYENLVLDASEAGALGMEVDFITDSSADGNIAVHGHYYGLYPVNNGIYIHFDVKISRLSPTDDFSFDTVTAGCTSCTYPDCGTITPPRRPCYSRKGDGYTNFGVQEIDRNLVSVGGTSVFSTSGLKIVITTDKNDYGITQAIWDDGKRRHDQFANLIAQKVMANYDAQAIALTLTPFSTSYAPGETIVISGNVADSSDSAPLAGASVAVNVAGTPLSATVDGAGDFSVNFAIPGDVGNVGYTVTVTETAPGYPDVTENVGFNVGEIPALSVTVDTDKDGYVAGDTVVIQGGVTDGGAGVPGAAVVVNVSGSSASMTADGSGGYRVEFPIPADTEPSTFNVTVTATGTTSGSATAATTFTVGDVMSVEIETDKDLYLIGDTVYCTVTVKDDSGQPVPGASLDGTATYTDSGRSTQLSGTTDSVGQAPWTFTWGQTPGGDTLAEGKRKFEVTASKSGLPDGTGSILISGCGDKEKAATEDCLDCPEDCTCGPNEVCDPSSDFRNSETMCGPKVAYVFVSNGLSAYHEWWASDDIAGIRKRYSSMGYTVPPSIYVDHINDIAPYLSRPSTKAIAYAGHGEDPGGMPTIEAAEATTGNFSVKAAIAEAGKKDKGFLGICQFGPYAVKWVDSKDKLEKILADRVEHPNLEYVFMFSCYSLDNLSMRDYLLQSGGTYWGYKGKLPGSASLVKSVKP
ncbi:MAG: hypothetical protein E4G93_02415 [Dehalococcoidia bacterium]|nr:MAG: hypothetical protein E4G93_02415 [Dehalococcoidia bacterium]